MDLLVNPDNGLQLTYLPQTYGDGRFAVRRTLATAGQGYTLLVADTWTGGYGVLKGLWWERKNLDDHRRSLRALERNNEQIRTGAEAVRRVTQLNQQAPVVVATVADPSPSLAAVEHREQDAPELFAVQQFVGLAGQPARTLQELIRERRESGPSFTELELLDLAAQLCDTLAALHGEHSDRTRWVHADVKPGNILVLGPPWRYLLIDYDGAVENGQEIPVTTEHYAPPRHARGNPELREAKPEFDIYMFGATLAEAAGLRRLDEDVREQLYGTPQQHTKGKQSLRQLGRGPILTAVIASCLASTSGRFRQMSAIAADLALARNATVLSGLLNSDNWT